MTAEQRQKFKAHAIKILREHLAGKKLGDEAFKWALAWARS